jgi:hypothetical protein
LVNLLLDRDPILRQRAHKRLTRAVLSYIYWNCDIGDAGDAIRSPRRARRIAFPRQTREGIGGRAF